MVECALHMHVRDYDSPEFQNEIPFRRGECKTREIPNYGIRAKS